MAARPPSADDFAELEVEQESQRWQSGASAAAPRSSCEESEWHLVDQSDCGSRPRSERDHAEPEPEAAAAGVEELASESSVGSADSVASTGENEQVADSVLQMSFLAERQSEAAEESEASAAAAAPHESEARLVRRMSGLSSEGCLEAFSEQQVAELQQQMDAAEGAEAEAAGAVAEAEAAAQGGDQPDSGAHGFVAAVKGTVLDLVTCLYAHVAHMLSVVKGNVVEQYEAVGQVVMESVTLAYRAAQAANRAVHEAVPSAVERAVGKLREAHPKRLSAAQWAALALGVSQLATAAVLVGALVRSHRLQRALAAKDRELGGLLMRIFSLQELVQQGGSRAVPLIRHASHMYMVN